MTPGTFLGLLRDKSQAPSSHTPHTTPLITVTCPGTEKRSLCSGPCFKRDFEDVALSRIWRPWEFVVFENLASSGIWRLRGFGGRAELATLRICVDVDLATLRMWCFRGCGGSSDVRVGALWGQQRFGRNSSSEFRVAMI